MLDMRYIGPNFDEGLKAAVFYFALSAHDSLFLDPFNQPALELQKSGLRVFSFTLPGHDTLPKETALECWTPALLTTFVDEVCSTIQELHQKQLITKCAVMGLSRGVFIAAHVAAKLSMLETLLGFAPLTNLSYVPGWDLPSLSEKLYSKTIRCYIGNRDVRTGTEKTFSWLLKLADLAFAKGIRTAPIELIISPSIGRDGHGTSPENFRAGAQWLAKVLS